MFSKHKESTERNSSEKIEKKDCRDQKGIWGMCSTPTRPLLSLIFSLLTFHFFEYVLFFGFDVCTVS